MMNHRSKQLNLRLMAAWLGQVNRYLIVGLGGLCLGLGLLAALVGGRWNALGSGPGGLGGGPMLLLLASTLLGLPALALAIVARVRGRLADWKPLLLVVGPLIIAV